VVSLTRQGLLGLGRRTKARLAAKKGFAVLSNILHIKAEEWRVTFLNKFTARANLHSSLQTNLHNLFNLILFKTLGPAFAGLKNESAFRLRIIRVYCGPNLERIVGCL
jgi:hypothetical protein